MHMGQEMLVNACALYFMAGILHLYASVLYGMHGCKL